MSENPPESAAKDDPQATPWYRRPGPIIGLVVLLLILAFLLPPVIATEVPVGLTQQGEQNAATGGWEPEESDGPITAMAGLVLINPVTLLRENDLGIRDGVYVYSTVKIPVMLPQGIVSDQLHENALDLLEDRGVRVDTNSHRVESYEGNGEVATISFYRAMTDSDGFFLGDTPVDLFIATWRCSVLGSHAVVVGAAGQDKNGGNNGGLFQGLGGSSSGNGADLQWIRDRLLAHTQCTT